MIQSLSGKRNAIKLDRTLGLLCKVNYTGFDLDPDFTIRLGGKRETWIQLRR